MIRAFGLAAIFTVALLGCAKAPSELQSVATLPLQVELTIAGPPIPASETIAPFIYKEPSLPDGIPPEYSGGLFAQNWSMFGREDRSNQLDPLEYDAIECPASSGNELTNAAVLDTLVEKAKLTRVVIINESHVNTLHRDFSRQLIERLRPHGFSVFVAETFRNTDDEPTQIERNAQLPYPHMWDGSYSQEAVFGRLVRSAKNLGYRLSAYEEVSDSTEAFPEDFDQSIAQREQAQVENLQAILATMSPEEKLIVHVGYSHAKEKESFRSDGFDLSWMGARLKRLTAIDPLTIEQASYCRGGGEEIRLASAPEKIEGWFDIIIDHPTYGFRYGRPEWRFAHGDVAVEIPEELRPKDGPLVIEAFADGEPFEAVPMDRIWVEPDEDIRLALPPGRYTVRAVIPVLADEESQ